MHINNKYNAKLTFRRQSGSTCQPGMSRFVDPRLDQKTNTGSLFTFILYCVCVLPGRRQLFRNAKHIEKLKACNVGFGFGYGFCF